MPDGVSYWLAATASGFNGAFIGNDSNLYFTGRGRLPSYFDENDTLFTPTLLPKPPGVTGWKSVSFNRDAAHIAVTGRGRAYYWDKDHPEPTFIPLPLGINRWEEAIAGDGYYLLLTDDGSLFGFGANSNGQLGNRSAEDKATPTRVYDPIGVYKWKSMAAGTMYGYSLGIDEHGKLYSWGVLYAAGSIGGEYIDSTKYEPAAYPSTESWEKVVIGGDRVLGLSQDGKIFTWGGSDSLLLGLGDGRRFLKVPTLIPFPEGVTTWKDISITPDASFAVDQDCRVWGWGYNSDGNSIGVPQTEGFVFRTPHLIRQFCQSSSVEQPIVHDLPSVRVFPNPASEQMEVEIDLPEAATIQVALTDLLGRERAVLFSGAADRGERRLQFNASSIEEGSYVLSVITPKVKRFVRVEVVR